jgi:lysosomal Pro-X carboxypeptidase
MWYGGSYTEDLSDTILALNFENGAHHSDLTHIGPQDDDTDDIKEGHIRIKQILEKWLDDMRTDNSR